MRFAAPDPATRTIAIAPVGRADPGLIAHLHTVLEEAFGRRAVDAHALPLDSRAYRPERGQWLASVILDEVARARGGCERILGITDVDLFVPDLNFVFGVADEGRGAALVSLARLAAPGDAERTLRRTATEAIHELGHAYGLDHCPDARCVMWFSNTLAETDRKGAGFCARHANAMRRISQGASSPGDGLTASPPRILVTGPPGVGKTTVVLRVLDLLQGRRVAGFYTEEVRGPTGRTGFRLVTPDGRTAQLATRGAAGGPRVGRYTVHVAALEAVCEDALDPGPGVDVVVIDEIGKMECLSPAFVRAARRALSSAVPVLGTVAQAGGGFIAQAKRLPGVEVIALSRENRDRLAGEIAAQLSGAAHAQP
jgi:nucleoside-triphosphatase THEP1/predicted Zn-dependent protease